MCKLGCRIRRVGPVWYFSTSAHFYREVIPMTRNVLFITWYFSWNQSKLKNKKSNNQCIFFLNPSKSYWIFPNKDIIGVTGVKNLECTHKMLLYVTVTRKVKRSSVSTSYTFPDWYASETFWRNKSWVTSLSQWLISSSNLVWPTLWPTDGYSPLGNFQTNRQHLKIVCY